MEGSQQVRTRADPARVPLRGNILADAETPSQASETAATVSNNVALSLAPNPFNPTGGMHTRAGEVDATVSKVPITAPGSWGVVVAGPGQSYLPFEVNYLTGVALSGGTYPTDYVDFASAQKLADYTGISGARIVMSCGGGFLDQTFPGSYGIQLPSGQVLDAGGLANLYQRYPKDYADARIQHALESARAVQLGTTFYAVDAEGNPMYGGTAAS
jgi:hypothetical protein